MIFIVFYWGSNNKCPECDARNTLNSTVCGNCGADITFIGKLKSHAKTAAVLAVIIILFMIFGGNGN